MSYKSALEKLPKKNTKEVNDQIRKEYESGVKIYKAIEKRKTPR